MCRSALPALLLLLASLTAAVVRGDTVAEKATTAALDRVCASLGGYYVTPGHCVAALCSDASDPCRAAREDSAVAALAARLAARNATAAQGSIQDAVSRGANATSEGGAEPQPTAASALSACLQLYAGAVPALRWAAASVGAGRFRGAREVLQAAQYVAAGCEGMAEGSATAAASALPSENGRFSDMAFVAHAVVAYMARN